MNHESPEVEFGYNRADKDLKTMSLEECKAWLEDFANVGEFRTLGKEQLDIAYGYHKRLKEEPKTKEK